MSTFSIDDVGWSEPKIVNTQQGRRRLRTWRIPKGSPFWGVWRTGYLREQGYTVYKQDGFWTVSEWREPDGDRPQNTVDEVRGAQVRDDHERELERLDAELPPYLRAGYEEVVAIYERILDETGNDYRYQLPSIKRLVLAVERFNTALDASDTGTGKTFVACAVARILGRDLFVVCPKSVRTPWKRAAELFDVPIDVINYEMLRTGNTPFGRWDTRRRSHLSYDGFDHDAVLFVFDECHRMKDYTTLNCKLGVSAIEQRFKVIGLSATAADNPMHMKFVSLLTGLISDANLFWGWMTSNGCRKGKWGMEFVGGREVLSRIHRQIFPVRGTRIRVSDLGDIFPQTTLVSEAYEMENSVAIQRVYQEMRREIAKLQARKDADWAANVLVEQLRARQEVELLKVPTFVQLAQDGLEEGMSVVVVLNFQASIDAVAQRLRTANTITGQDDPDNRQLLIDQFNEDDEHVIVMNIKIGGVGIGLHGRAGGRPRLGLLGPTFSPIDMKQAIGRFPRAGGATSIVKVVWAANTIEERACTKMRAGLQRVSIFNDDQLDTALASLQFQLS